MKVDNIELKREGIEFYLKLNRKEYKLSAVNAKRIMWYVENLLQNSSIRDTEVGLPLPYPHQRFVIMPREEAARLYVELKGYKVKPDLSQ